MMLHYLHVGVNFAPLTCCFAQLSVILKNTEAVGMILVPR